MRIFLINMFTNRQEAGKLLGKKVLGNLRSEKKDLIVLGLPRGGVVVAHEVAKILACPLDVVVVKKIGAPGQPELALGAVAKTPESVYLNKELVNDLNVGNDYIEEIRKLRNLEIKEKELLYRQGKPALDLKNKTVIIVDDGAATGATTISAVREVWNNKPKKTIIALPVAAKDTLWKLEKEADSLIYLDAPEIFFSVGEFYQDFPQVEDEEVRSILR